MFELWRFLFEQRLSLRFVFLNYNAATLVVTRAAPVGLTGNPNPLGEEGFVQNCGPTPANRLIAIRLAVLFQHRRDFFHSHADGVSLKSPQKRAC